MVLCCTIAGDFAVRSSKMRLPSSCYWYFIKNTVKAKGIDQSILAAKYNIQTPPNLTFMDSCEAFMSTAYWSLVQVLPFGMLAVLKIGSALAAHWWLRLGYAARRAKQPIPSDCYVLLGLIDGLRLIFCFKRKQCNICNACWMTTKLNECWRRFCFPPTFLGRSLFIGM